MCSLQKVFGLLPNRIRRQEVFWGFFLDLTVSLGRTGNKIGKCWDSMSATTLQAPLKYPLQQRQKWKGHCLHGLVESVDKNIANLYRLH